MTEKMLMIIFIALASVAAKHEKTLTFSGAALAFVVGTAIYLGFGMKGFILLGSFFITSSLWSKFKKADKGKIDEKLAKGSIRDWRQVLANGGTAAIIAFSYYLSNQQILMAAFAVAIASANSDTWASEIGTLSKKSPIDIRTLKRVEKGTSGAISLLGTFAALLGSFIIALLSYFLFHFKLIDTLLIFVFGYIGNLIDTIFGAFYQQKFQCQYCNIETEKKVHCGANTTRIKGYALIDNDMVNFLSGFIAVLCVIGFILLIK